MVLDYVPKKHAKPLRGAEAKRERSEAAYAD